MTIMMMLVIIEMMMVIKINFLSSTMVIKSGRPKKPQ